MHYEPCIGTKERFRTTKYIFRLVEMKFGYQNKDKNQKLKPNKMTDLFKQQVWEITKLIPKGRVSSYGAIAKAVGFPNHSRQVGKAMGGCAKDIPAHRVISSSGVLSVPEFQTKLEAEGIEVVNLRIKNFKKLFWNPLEEL